MSISKIFIPNFVCVLTNERYRDFGALGCPGGGGGKKIFFSNKVMLHIKSLVMSSRTECKYSFYGQTGDLGVRSKAQLSLNFGYLVNSKFFIPNFVCVLTNKR